MVKSTGSTKKESLLSKSIEKIIGLNLAVKKDESLLIVYDTKKESLAKQFESISKKRLLTVHSIKIPELEFSGQEPPIEVARLFLSYDVLIFLTTKSLSHTEARKKATKKGIRIASMPGITEDILKRCIDIDYVKLKKNTKKLVSLLNKGKGVRIEKDGSILEFSIKGRKGHGLSAGIYDKSGKWGNLPEGEAFIAPQEGTANGKVIVDGSIAGTGKVKKVIIDIKAGLATNVIGDDKLKKTLKKIGTKARNIAEFGIGLNEKAKVTGVVLEDEKVKGTIHIALGNNSGFGGIVNVPFHADCVIRNPTVYVDNKKIMEKGALIL